MNCTKQRGGWQRPDNRETNASKRLDLRGLVNNVHGTRKITSVELVEHREGSRQMVVLTCTCGAVTRMPPSVYLKQGVGTCKKCSGRGTSVRPARKRSERTPLDPTRAKGQPHDYDAWVGKVVGDFAIESIDKSVKRPLYTVRCSAGHTFTRQARQVLTEGVKRCPGCVKPSRAEKALPEPVAITSYGDEFREVCDCAWSNGRQRVICRGHRRSA